MKTLMILAWSMGIFVSCYAADIRNGSYEIQTRTLLPHLEEMRRTVTSETACIKKDEISDLFPILKQPGMVDCNFTTLEKTDDAQTYTLQCPGKNGAKGTAILKIHGEKIGAELNAKLGGKNMTFSQYVQAEWQGPCAVVEAVH